MRRDPLISILTLSFNHYAFLPNNIESVSSQTYLNYEHLIIDAGSRDGSREYLLGQAKKNSKLVLIFEPDDGPADGLHKAMKRALGEIIICLNSDDYFIPGALNSVAEMYLARPDAAGYTANGYVLNEKLGKKKFQFTDKVTSWRFSTGKLCVMHPSTAYNADFIRTNNLNFNTKSRTCWDWEMLADILIHKGKFVKTNRIWSVFRIHGNQRNSSGALTDEYNKEVAAIQEKFYKDSKVTNVMIKNMCASLLRVYRKFMTILFSLIS